MGKGNIDLSQRGISRMKVIMAAVCVVTAVFIALLMTLFRGGYFRRKRWSSENLG
jgi:hypothetical protein